METSLKNQTSNTVLGKVTDANGRQLANLKVGIYNVDMREWQALAEAFHPLGVFTNNSVIKIKAQIGK